MRKTYGENITDSKGSNRDGRKGDSYTHACASFLRLCRINGVFVSTAHDRRKRVAGIDQSGAVSRVVWTIGGKRAGIRKRAHYLHACLFSRITTLRGGNCVSITAFPDTRVFTDNKTLSHVPPPLYLRKTRRMGG